MFTNWVDCATAMNFLEPNYLQKRPYQSPFTPDPVYLKTQQRCMVGGRKGHRFAD